MKDTPTQCGIVLIKATYWSNTYLRMEQDSKRNAIVDARYSGAGDVGTDSNDQWRLIGYITTSNQWGYYYCLQNVKMGQFVSFDTSGCGTSGTDNGCGSVGVSSTCGAKSQFIVNNNVNGWVSSQNPNIMMRMDGRIIKYTAQGGYLAGTSAYAATIAAPVPVGGGVVNGQYHADINNNPSSSWESFSYKVLGGC